MTLSPPFRLLSRALAAASLIVTGLVLPGTVPTAAAATCGTSNIAQGKTATASSTENGSFPAANAVDGNTGTRWSSAFSDPQWLEVDLGSSQSICQVTLNWEAAYGKAFQIQTSDRTTPPGPPSTPPPPEPAAPRTSPSPAPDGTSACTAPPVPPSTATPSGNSRSSARATGGGGTGCTGQSNTPNFGPNVYIFDPGMSSCEHPDHAQQRSSTRRSSTSSAPSGTRCCSSRAPTAPKPTSATTPRSRAWGRTRMTSPSTVT